MNAIIYFALFACFLAYVVALPAAYDGDHKPQIKDVRSEVEVEALEPQESGWGGGYGRGGWGGGYGRGWGGGYGRGWGGGYGRGWGGGYGRGWGGGYGRGGGGGYGWGR